MEIPNRLELEQKLGKRLTTLSNRHKKQLRSLLGSPPDIDSVPDSFWQRVEKETEEETVGLIILLFMASAISNLARTGIGFSDARTSLTASADIYGTRSARTLAQKYAGGARATLAAGAETLAPVVVPAVVGDGGEILKAPTMSPPTRGEVEDRLEKTFGVNRVERMTITDTTSAQSAGGEAAAQFAASQENADLWITEDDAKVCPICEPLHRKTRGTWSARFPQGPPAHDRCRCFIEYAHERGDSEGSE